MSFCGHFQTRLWVLACAVLCLCGTLALPSHAAPDLKIVKSTSSATLPTANAGFPHPKEKHQLFFLQRTTNANTVVYVARFDANGDLIPDKPVAGYWRRYAGSGRAMALRWYERVFGFGVKTRRIASTGNYDLRFNGLKSHRLELRQNGPFDAALYTRQKDREFRMIYGYLDVDESGLLPKVTRLRLYTSDPQTGHFVTHTIAVSGGAYRE